MELTDQPREVRQGEELDVARVGAYLKAALPDLKGDVTVRQFPRGFSNLTYLVTVGARELVLRRPPFGTKAKTAHDMGREYRILRAIAPVFPQVPRVLAYCEDPSVLGAPFYVMERIAGIILRKELPAGLTFSPPQAAMLCRNLLDLQHRLHAIDYAAAGLGDFGRTDGYARRQVDGWSRRYRRARTDDAPDFEAVMAWLDANQPADSAHSGIVHNDFKLDNVVLDGEGPLKIIGVLDWEMATLGDPLMDLGNSLAYWVEAGDPEEMQLMRLVPTHIDGALSRVEMVAHYEKLAGRPIGDFSFYYAFGLFRLAVIAQQIYYRYYHGQTQDQRFALLVFAVAALERRAREVVAEGFR